MLLFCFVVMLILSQPTSSLSEMLSVSSDGVNLRSGPGTNYDIKWEFGKGFPLQVLSKEGDWYKVQDFENDIGWIYKSLLFAPGHMIVKVNKKSNKKINIRSGP